MIVIIIVILIVVMIVMITVIIIPARCVLGGCGPSPDSPGRLVLSILVRTSDNQLSMSDNNVIPDPRPPFLGRPGGFEPLT